MFSGKSVQKISGQEDPSPLQTPQVSIVPTHSSASSQTPSLSASFVAMLPSVAHDSHSLALGTKQEPLLSVASGL